MLNPIGPTVLREINAFNAIFDKKPITYPGEDAFIDCGEIAAFVVRKLGAPIENDYVYRDYKTEVKVPALKDFMNRNFTPEIAKMACGFIDQMRFTTTISLQYVDSMFHDLFRASPDWRVTPCSPAFHDVPVDTFTKALNDQALDFRPVLTEAQLRAERSKYKSVGGCTLSSSEPLDVNGVIAMAIQKAKELGYTEPNYMIADSLRHLAELNPGLTITNGKVSAEPPIVLIGVLKTK